MAYRFRRRNDAACAGARANAHCCNDGRRGGSHRTSPDGGYDLPTLVGGTAGWNCVSTFLSATAAQFSRTASRPRQPIRTHRRPDDSARIGLHNRCENHGRIVGGHCAVARSTYPIAQRELPSSVTQFEGDIKRSGDGLSCPRSAV